ncbi:MAG: glycosyltransferase family 39 protein [Pirellulales bacterium]|nr:glycosyltransferase family 39 protein [Pirellulales bacterium]
MLGALVCWRWASDLGGPRAGALALGLWTLSPAILGHAALITADVAAASFALLAGWRFHIWLVRPALGACVAAGTALGLALLAKFTCLLLLPCFLLVWSVRRLAAGRYPALAPVTGAGNPPAWQLLLLLFVSLLAVNAAYGFDGTGTPLGSLRLRSLALRTVTGRTPLDARASDRSCWSAASCIPSPLPSAFVQGIDEQLQDFQRFNWTFVAGRWHARGRWYYYLYALIVKAPLGHWLTFGLALLALVRVGSRVLLQWQMLLLEAPACSVFVAVSSQTSWNAHARYLLPAAGFFFVWMAVLLSMTWHRFRTLRVAIPIALAISLASVCYHYPNMLGYYNELAGGPTQGHRHLRGSNTDWGQDLYALRDWLGRHPHTLPVFVDLSCSLNLEALGIDYRPLLDPCRPAAGVAVGQQPGWYAISVNALTSPGGSGPDWTSFKPVAKIGGSIWIFHVPPPSMATPGASAGP